MFVLKVCFQLVLTVAVTYMLLACSPNSSTVDSELAGATRSIESRLNAHFLEVQKKHFKAPDVHRLDVDFDPQGAAIWGATGRDDDGNIYLGISTYSKEQRTAFLYQYQPALDLFVAQGDVLSNLKRLGIYQPGMGQSKLHSKFYQANDGYIYFSSFDEEGENSKRNSKWGGNLWRKLPDSSNWEHLIASKEALIAVNTAGRYVYALGYWDHVLYQYDSLTSMVERVKVGSIEGHISRNIIVNLDEHVFVPRVTRNTNGTVVANLVEYDSKLQEVAQFPMPEYKATDMKEHHGIVGYTPLRDGSIYFTTSEGTLYLLEKDANQRNKLSSFGFFHPDGEAYISSLFSLDGDRFLVGLANNVKNKGFDWLIREASSDITVDYPVKQLNARNQLLYGSVSRDNSGSLYVVGVDMSNRRKHVPLVIKLF
jgi:hypothetical protein